jgi:hypothetical protein
VLPGVEAVELPDSDVPTSHLSHSGHPDSG